VLHSRRHSINQFNVVSKTIYYPVVHLVAAAVLAASAARGADTPAKYLGANSCASSSCHGGGGASQNQFLVWSLKDFHSQRPPATLATARSKQIADALNIKDATADARCTVCHAPLREVPENLRGENFKASEGVSCESCHGPAENWIRSHTRTDYTRADRTAAGMRDLQSLYVRANVCVACHQNVDADILAAGHPELIFELDGQSVAEPKHWRAEKNGNGAQAWLVGQAVALREMEWQIAKSGDSNANRPDEKTIARKDALFWLMQKVSTADSSLPVPSFLNTNYVSRTVQEWADKLARAADTVAWTDIHTKKCLVILAGSSKEFGNPDYQLLEARRAERLVLALDRLVAALPELKNNAPVQTALNQLFQLAQSIPDFDPKRFADALQQFSAALPAQP
jgi:hypothetical protein